MKVKNKNIIVTGAANGIGRKLTEILLQNKANIFAIDINTKALKSLKEDFPPISINECDLSESTQVEATINQIAEESGSGIDILINNAGVIYNSPLLNFLTGSKHSIEEWNKVISNNLSSVFYTTVNIIETMVKSRTKGVIINLSSICAQGNPGQSAYSATKAGVEALTQSWAKELAPLGIRVACVAPGFCETETTMNSISSAMIKEIKDKIPTNRFATVDEIANGVLFTIENDYFNGKTLSLDGGLKL